jgi:hypothetical protein
VALCAGLYPHIFFLTIPHLPFLAKYLVHCILIFHSMEDLYKLWSSFLCKVFIYLNILMSLVQFAFIQTKIWYTSSRKLPHSWFQTFAVFWMLYAFFWVISFTYPPVASMWVVTLHNLFLYSDPSLPCNPPSYCLRLFSSQTFSRINNPTFLKPSHSSCLPAYEDGTVFRNVGI